LLPSGKLTVSELENGPNRNRWFTELNSMVIFYSYVKLSEANAKWGPQTIAKLVYNSNVTMVYGTYNYSIHGVYKPSNITGGAHLVEGDGKNLASLEFSRFFDGTFTIAMKSAAISWRLAAWLPPARPESLVTELVVQYPGLAAGVIFPWLDFFDLPKMKNLLGYIPSGK